MLITYKQLLDIFGGSSAAELVLRLKKAGIRYCIGKRNQPFTTLTALNFSMDIVEQQTMVNIMNDMQQEDHIEIEV